MDLLTQWRVGPGGIVGLDYGVLPMVFDIRGIDSGDRAEIFSGIKIMEASALDTLREKD